ncbi:MAG: DUF3837 domain-containing protein [Lachnospiraceae bacterium]|nr:DUF3837 domain-containing protein [Lachnospiraceae bacterium]
MVPELARQAVIIKSRWNTSTMTGNYEMGYAVGVLTKVSGVLYPADFSSPAQLKEKMLELLENYEPGNEHESNTIQMLKYYEPDETMDEQFFEMINMGLSEKTPWKR